MRIDVFENFVKIAEEKGLLSGITSEEAKKKLEEDPRMDSLDISAIEALYGVKPDAPKEMEYEKNIVEIAHPESVIIAPSYDKLNGLVENVNERQNIILNIVKQTPDGMIRNKKYAEKELIMNLVRIGNVLDNKDEDELCLLADTCLSQTSSIQKQAFLGGSVAAVVVPISLTLAYIYAQQHLPDFNKGFEANYKNLLSEVQDMIDDNADWGVGRDYTQKFKTQLGEFKKNIISFKSKYDRIVSVIDAIEIPKKGSELLILARSPKNNVVLKAFNLLNKEVEDFLPYLVTTDRNFRSETYKLKQIKDKGVLTRFVDWTQVLHGGAGLIVDDFDDVRNAMKPYVKSIMKILNVLKKAKSVQKYAKRQLASSMMKERKNTSVPVASETPENSFESKVREEFSGLEDELKEIGIKQ